MHGDYELLVNLSVSLVLALVFGLITQRLHLSPIVGYLLAGVALGPHTPGFEANPKLASELAEIGVILLMFGVGMHFDLGDLLAVKRIAITGACGQILVASALGTLAFVAAGFGLGAGLVIGIAVSVASTVVLVRVLMDNNVLDSPQGHIAVGWLIVEDIFTVLVLVAMPALAGAFGDQAADGPGVYVALALAVAKVGVLGAIVIVGGKYAIPWLLRHVARARSRELFTLSVLAIAMAIATGSAVLFGVSMALGAFLAGMVVGQTDVSHQAAADALPMRDAFAVLFFVSVGMLFNPRILVEQTSLFLTLLAVVLLAKPLTAFLIVWALRYSVRTALIVAVSLAQIGEFSFLLADQAMRDRLLPAAGQSLLVACAIVSITLNPLLFRAIAPVERWLRSQPRLWTLLSQRSDASGAMRNLDVRDKLSGNDDERPVAVIVGYGPVGQTAARILKEFQVRPVIVDLNVDTIRSLAEAGELAVYGDATQRDILQAAGIREAKYLLVTIPEVLVRTVVIIAAKDLNPNLLVFARARYLHERAWLEEVGATGVVTEEGETALGLAVLLLREVGADENHIHKEILRIQKELQTPLDVAN